MNEIVIFRAPEVLQVLPLSINSAHDIEIYPESLSAASNIFTVRLASNVYPTAFFCVAPLPEIDKY